MKFLNDLTIKYLKNNKERTIATIIGIMIGVAMIMTVSMLAESSKVIISDTQKVTDGSSEVNVTNLNKKNVLDLKDNAKLKTVAPYIKKDLVEIAENVKGEEHTVDGRIYYIDKKEIEKNPNIYFGDISKEKKSFEENTVIINKSLVNLFKEKNIEGKNLKIQKIKEIDDENEDRKVKAINSSEENAEEKIGEKEDLKIDYITSGNRINYAAIFIVKDFEKENLLDKEGNFGAALEFKNKNKVYEEAGKILYANGITKSSDLKMQENAEYNEMLLISQDTSNPSKISSVLWIVQIFLFAVIGVATILVIYNSFSISIAERRKDYGMLISIGASKNQIKKLVRFEAILMATIGLVLGFTIGVLGIKVLYLMLNKLINGIIAIQSKSGLGESIDVKLKMTFNSIVFITTIIVTYIVTYLGIMWPARKASKTSPIESIKGIDEVVIKSKKVKTSKLSKRILGVEGDLASKSLKRNRSKYRITIVSLTVSVVIFLIVQNTFNVGGQQLDNISPDVFKEADYIGKGFFGTNYSNNDVRKDNVDTKKYMKEFNEKLDKEFKDEKFNDQNVLNVVNINEDIFLSYKDFKVNEKEKNNYLDYLNKEYNKKIENLDKTFYSGDNAEKVKSERKKALEEDKEYLNEHFKTKIIAAEGKILEDYLKKNNIKLSDGEGIIVGKFVKDTKTKFYNNKILNSTAKDEIEFKVTRQNEKLENEKVTVTKLKNVKVLNDEKFPTLINGQEQENLGAVIVNINTFKKIYEDTLNKNEELKEKNGKQIKEIKYKDLISSMKKDEIPKEEELENIKREIITYDIPNINYTKMYKTTDLNEKEQKEFKEYIKELNENSFSTTNPKEGYISIYINYVDIASMFAVIRAVTTIMKILIYGFIGLIVLISVSNVFNTISTNIILRQREFANLKSMGMTSKQMKKMLDFESLLYGIKVIIYGTLISLGLMKLLEYLVSKEVSTTFNISITSIIIVIISVMVIIFTTMRYARSKIDKMNIIDVIKKGSI